MNTFVFGTSQSNLPILAYTFGKGKKHALVLAGVHGDETEGVIAAFGLLNFFKNSYPFSGQLTLVPMFNLDGVLAKTRVNSRGVDLNRNLPTNDWNPRAFNDRYPPGPHANSESENKALTEFLEKHKPELVISLHSWKPMLNINGDCRKYAEAISTVTGYVIEETIGYPTPGCLGTYAGLERKMPTVTYEIERGSSPDTILNLHPMAVAKALEIYFSGSTT